MRDTAFTLELNRLCVGDRFYQRAFISGLISRPIYQHHFENPWLIKGHFGLERISDQRHGSSDNLVRNKDDLSKTSCLDKESLKIILKPDMSTSSNRLSDTLGFWPTPLPPTFKKVQKCSFLLEINTMKILIIHQRSRRHYHHYHQY